MRFFADNSDYREAVRNTMRNDRDFELRMDMKAARKLKAAMHKGTFEKLTNAEADALDDLITELLMQVEG